MFTAQKRGARDSTSRTRPLGTLLPGVNRLIQIASVKPETAAAWHPDERDEASQRPIHRLRHTFAVSLLQKGVSIEIVSVFLAHSSIRVTERHYAPWVKARQEQLEAAVRKAW